MPRGDQYREFLLAVVNGDGRSPSPEKQRQFDFLYHAWFLRQTSTALQAESEYRSRLEWWELDDNELPTEELRKGLHIAVLRHKLKLIWRMVILKDYESAERKVGYLKTDVHRYSTRFTIIEEWRSRQLKACSWLLKNVRRLKMCRSPSCTSPFFVRDEKNQQYCSKDCASEGQRLQWIARRGPPKERMTPEGSAAISLAVTKRWQEIRSAKKRLKAKPSPSGDT